MATYGKSILILGVLIVGGFFTGTVYSDDIKIGSVDIQKAVNECNAGKEDKKALTKEMEKFRALAAEKQKELQGMKESLEKEGLILNPETREVREKELQTKLRDFQRWGEDVQNELNQKRMQMERDISIGLMKVVQEIGAKESYTIILEQNKNIVLFTPNVIDLTDRVMNAYDAQMK